MAGEEKSEKAATKEEVVVYAALPLDPNDSSWRNHFSIKLETFAFLYYSTDEFT